MKLLKQMLVTLVCAITIPFTSCNKSDDLTESETLLSLLQVSTSSASEGITTFAVENICPVLDLTNPLTANEIEFLFAMREDEKLAKDLYTTFANQYPANIQFANIAVAETNHIATIERVFSYYEIEYPALSEKGVFANPILQEKYNTNMQTNTALEAFLVMAKLEEENIVSYSELTTNATNANLKLLLENMTKASINHLKAADRWITILGSTYTPFLINPTQYEEIIKTPFVQGNRYGIQNGKGGNGSTNAQKGGQSRGQKGAVNGMGVCTQTTNGTYPGTGDGQGGVGKGYRVGK